VPLVCPFLASYHRRIVLEGFLDANIIRVAITKLPSLFKLANHLAPSIKHKKYVRDDFTRWLTVCAVQEHFQNIFDTPRSSFLNQQALILLHSSPAPKDIKLHR
jgi:hypothetical protein